MKFYLFKTSLSKDSDLSKSLFDGVPTKKTLNNLSTISTGFSLIEVMITISILSIALTIALPSLSGFLAQMRVDDRITQLHRFILTARNSAINTGQNAQLCPLLTFDTCQNTTDWSGRVGVVTDADGLITEMGAIKDGDKLQYNFNSVIYGPDGQLDNNNIGTFSYCPESYPDYSRGVTISLSGRAYLSSDSNGDGKEEDRDGNNIECN